MLEILEETKDDLVAIKVTGKLTKKDYEILNPVMEKTLKDHDKPKMYCEMHELEIPTAKAMWEEMKNLPHYNKFDKCALVSSAGWMSDMAKIADTTMAPDVKAYDITEKVLALQWLE